MEILPECNNNSLNLDEKGETLSRNMNAEIEAVPVNSPCNHVVAFARTKT